MHHPDPADIQAIMNKGMAFDKEIEKMNDHFMDIAKIIAENLALTKEEMWEKVA